MTLPTNARDISATGSLCRRFRRVLFRTDGQPLGRRHVAGRDEGSPGLARLRAILGGLSRDRRDPDKDMTGRALNFSAGKLLVTLQVLLAVGTGKFEFAHRLLAFGWCKAWPKGRQDAIALLRRFTQIMQNSKSALKNLHHPTSNFEPRTKMQPTRFEVRCSLRENPRAS